jgi:hypothetical protein
MNDVAGPGEIYVCACCGRRSKDRLGVQKIHTGWDESCMLNAVKYREADLVLNRNGTVSRVREGAEPVSTFN